MKVGQVAVAKPIDKPVTCYDSVEQIIALEKQTPGTFRVPIPVKRGTLHREDDGKVYAHLGSLTFIHEIR